jgi:hypothetical protein
MPDLDTILLRSSLGSLEPSGASCDRCERTPLPGERMHELDSGRLLCELCFAILPDHHRVAVRSERVRVGGSQLAVVSKVT